jgi:hypothetical protein
MPQNRFSANGNHWLWNYLRKFTKSTTQPTSKQNYFHDYSPGIEQINKIENTFISSYLIKQRLINSDSDDEINV